MSRPHGKRVRRWGGKPLPLPRLEPDEPTKDVKDDWRRHSDPEAVMRQAYDDQRHAAAAAVLAFLAGRQPSDLKTAADLAMFWQLTARFDELAQAGKPVPAPDCGGVMVEYPLRCAPVL